MIQLIKYIQCIHNSIKNIMKIIFKPSFSPCFIEDKGFTLTEVLIVISIISIALSIAIPDFVKSSRMIQSKHQAKEMVSAIKLLQSEAMRLRQPLVMCRNNQYQTNCDISSATQGDWSYGWSIFIDQNSNGKLDNNESRLALKQAVTKNYKIITKSNSLANKIVANSTGEIIGYMGTFDFYHEDSKNNVVELTINIVGRVLIKIKAV